MKQHDQRRNYWRDHLCRCRELGLTPKAYALQEGLAVSVLYDWNQRLTREAQEASFFQRVRVEPRPSFPFRLHLPNG